MELRSPALPDLPLRGSPMLPRPTLVIGIRHELENLQRAMGHHGTGPPFDSLQLPETSSWMNFGLWMFMVDTTNYFMEVINQLRTGGQHPVGPGQSNWPFLNGLTQVPENDVVFVCFLDSLFCTWKPRGVRLSKLKQRLESGALQTVVWTWKNHSKEAGGQTVEYPKRYDVPFSIPHLSTWASHPWKQESWTH